MEFDFLPLGLGRPVVISGLILRLGLQIRIQVSPTVSQSTDAYMYLIASRRPSGASRTPPCAVIVQFRDSYSNQSLRTPKPKNFRNKPKTNLAIDRWNLLLSVPGFPKRL